MKNIIIIGIVLISGACSDHSPDKIELFIPGTYTTLFTNDYFKNGHDTLIITQLHQQTNMYSIERHISYQKVVDKQIEPIQHKMEKLVGIYDPEMKIMTEQKHGLEFFFEPERNQLVLGNRYFTKINN